MGKILLAYVFFEQIFNVKLRSRCPERANSNYFTTDTSSPKLIQTNFRLLGYVFGIVKCTVKVKII